MRIEQIEENFKIDIGAPMPTILSNEYSLYLIFYIRDVDPNWDGKSVKVRNKKNNGIVTVKFDGFTQYKFGNPNDETIDGHPLYKFGLEPYSIQKVIGSEWIKELMKMNSVHPAHKDEYFKDYEHFIFFFHDTCLEVVATGYSFEKDSESNMREEIQRVCKLL
ncbi:hypothetical protein FUAX_41300 (plasmid) [Fulvitalea axinellae]|uniref:Uncharacterized protein n=1 Tax=Fulvitalea axinellae TaxID=1182444 RepID=A0AAU9CN45_9BACT|nr:hypothetical protein FUAX_41300 [Fulvitalea axinellae]